ncbi:DUF2510 domain-containing protein [Arthrobacter celericrescens]|uniref:DUF2510 domain-containing protein n=1 Tax=Arthrobacter celericrescens TaxID=2320851 RepID=UPI000EA26613|nr:DUF2510 domain-containing protein [Arthrobacter celericrescens]
MTHPGSGSTPPPGWYPDPADTRRSRWWDGTAWTHQVAGGGPPFQQAQPIQAGQPLQTGQPLRAGPPPRPQIDSRTPVDNPYIWGVVLLPLLSVTFLLAWNPEIRFRTVGTRQVLDPASLFTPWYFAIVVSSFLLYGVSVLLAYLDWQKLSQDGVVRPFHWAWCFLSPAVYVIGRSVIVYGVAAGRGLAPVWALIGTFVLSAVVASIKVSIIMAQVMSSIPR